MVGYYLISAITVVAIVLLAICTTAVYSHLARRHLPHLYDILWAGLLVGAGLLLVRWLIFDIYPRVLVGLGGHSV